MQELTIQLDRADAGYVPGEPITGRVSWDLDQSPDKVTVRLLWHTEGKGTQDVGVAAEEVWEPVSMRDQRGFEFAGLEGPYSFSGRLITLGWMIEAEAGRQHAEAALTLSPTGGEVRL